MPLTYEDFKQLDLLEQLTVSLEFAQRGRSGVRVIAPADWRAKAAQFGKIRFAAPPLRQREMLRILQTDDAELALKHLISASPGKKLHLLIFVEAIEIFVIHLLRRRLTRDEARNLLNAVRTVQRYQPKMLDPFWTDCILPELEHDALLDRIPGRQPRLDVGALSSFFRKRIGRPVNEATAALLRAAESGRAYEAKDVTTLLTRQRKGKKKLTRVPTG